MRKYLLYLFIFCCGISLKSQEVYRPFYYTQVFIGDNQLKSPLVGGLNSPLIQGADLNRDGFKDLVIYEKVGQRILTFLNDGLDGGHYTFAPEYAANIPPITGWFILEDVTCDGIEDFFTDTIQAGTFSFFKGAYDANNHLIFTIKQRTMPYEVASGISNVYSTVIEKPTLDDINNDGDVDVLSFNVDATRITYYENQQVEKGLPCDTMIFKRLDDCWGNIKETGLSIPLDLRDTCFNKPPLREIEAQPNLHAGSVMEIYDVDGNGRKDVLLGDVILQNVNFLKNTGTLDYASILEQDTAFPSYDVPVSINSFANPFIFDFDNDGKNDLLVSPFEANGGENYKNILFYKNISNTAALDLRFQARDVIVSDMIDVGSGAIPEFFDYNADGKLDIILGNDGRKEGNNDPEYLLSVYENIGTNTYPYFKLAQTDYMGLNANGLQTPSAAPAFADLDGDGDQDAFIGREDGRLMYFKNLAASGGVPQFSFVQLLKDNSNNEIDIQQNAMPEFVDIDRNGTMDLILGERNGNLNYYKNIGTTTNFSFTLVTDSLGKIKVGGGGFNPGYSYPEVEDYDGDSKWDMLLGDIYGNAFFYSNIEDNMQGPWTLTSDTLLKTTKATRSTFATADLTNDGKLEILKGYYTGGLEIFSPAPPPYQPVGIRNTLQPTLAIQIFPNPTSEQCMIRLPKNMGEQNYLVEIYTLEGKQVYSKSYKNDENISISTSQWSSGIYFIRLSNEKSYGIAKMVVQ